MSGSEPPPVSARRLTARADLEGIADWCGGELHVDVATGVCSIVLDSDQRWSWAPITAVLGDWVVRDGDRVVIVRGGHADAILRAGRQDRVPEPGNVDDTDEDVGTWDRQATIWAALDQEMRHNPHWVADLIATMAAAAELHGGVEESLRDARGWERDAVGNLLESAGVGVPDAGHAERAEELRRRYIDECELDHAAILRAAREADQ